jgi:hypothetical protein
VSEHDRVGSDYSLSELEKERIRAEERYRAAAQETIAKLQAGRSRWVRAINSPFAIFLLSGVLVAGISWLFQRYLDALEKRRVTATEIRALLYELDYRALLLERDVKSRNYVWTHLLVRNHLFTIHSDSAFTGCTLRCLGSRLTAFSWSQEASTAATMNSVRNAALALEDQVSTVVPDSTPAPLTDAEATQLRPAVDALRSAVNRNMTLFGISTAPSTGEATLKGAQPT